MLINDFIKENELVLPDKLLHGSIELNKSLVKLPFIETDLDILLDYNIYDVYQGVLEGVDIPLLRGAYSYHVKRSNDRWAEWGEWLRKVIWYETKKGAYLYNCKALNLQTQ